MKNQKDYVLVSLVILVILAAVVLLLILFSNDDDSNSGAQTSEITTFQECVDAGNPVLESFPEQCVTEDGQSFVNPDQKIDNGGNGSSGSNNQEYYGSSTFEGCSDNSDCMPNGCNSEICGSSNPTLDSPIVSICALPEEPLPRDLGYSCGCVDNQCMWNK